VIFAKRSQIRCWIALSSEGCKRQLLFPEDGHACLIGLLLNLQLVPT